MPNTTLKVWFEMVKSFTRYNKMTVSENRVEPVLAFPTTMYWGDVIPFYYRFQLPGGLFFDDIP